MEIQIVTEETIRTYKKIFPAGIAENILRSPFTFLAAGEEKDMAGLCFVTARQGKNPPEKTARILSFTAEDQKTASALLTEYERILKEQGIGKSILYIPEREEISEGVEKSLRKQGYEVSKREGENLTVTAKEILSLEKLKTSQLPRSVRPLGEFSGRSLRRGLASCLKRDERAHIEDLKELPLEWYEPEISCCMETGGRILGFLLVHRMADERLRVEALTSLGEAGKNGLFQLLCFSAAQLGRLYPEDTQVLLPGRDEATIKLIRYFFPGHPGDPVRYAEKNI